LAKKYTFDCVIRKKKKLLLSIQPIKPVDLYVYKNTKCIKILYAVNRYLRNKKLPKKKGLIKYGGTELFIHVLKNVKYYLPTKNKTIFSKKYVVFKLLMFVE